MAVTGSMPLGRGLMPDAEEKGHCMMLLLMLPMGILQGGGAAGGVSLSLRLSVEHSDWALGCVDNRMKMWLQIPSLKRLLPSLVQGLCLGRGCNEHNSPRMYLVVWIPGLPPLKGV